ncbi:carbon-nitrogen hydrolase family protein [Pseudoduganella chitinolytica]|uniref:Carbon-nitrogen hydrolase family protein n=1 Tax=Pseudoduganella chitinolytica TaxID=34070 RepID=A0ABY8BI45_9BURK|nr:carbon-nitrogen hydrolase family protein [Pseudoduganella chitinolytica]WEF35607.1 carbon-nitrogen hydrolase family protein [Pseudoduganella chitinolytica]
MTPVCVAAVQAVVARGDIAANVARHGLLARRAAGEGARLALFPELSLTGYEPALAAQLALRPDDVRLAPLRDAAASAGIVIVAGAPLANPDGKPHIAALTFHPDGRIDTYTKQYLHPGEETAFAAGSGGAAFDVAGSRIVLAVCVDITHAEHAAAAARDGAQLYAASVLVSVNGYAADAALLQGYAAAHRMPVLMANHGGATGGWEIAGRSALWNERGELVAAVPGDGECVLVAWHGGDGWCGRIVQ